MEWFEQLKRAKELLETFADKGADNVRIFTKFMRETADSLDKAANAFDPTPQGQSVALGMVHTQELETFLADCQKEANQSHAATEASGWKEIGLTLLIDLVSRLVEKYRNRPKQ